MTLTLSAAAPSTSAPGSSLIPETTDLFTGGAFAVIAILTVLVVLGLIYGARLRSRRRDAERELNAHNREIVSQAPAAAPPLAPAVTAPPAPPIAAAPAMPDQPRDRASDLLAPGQPKDEPIAAATPPLAENSAVAAQPEPAPQASDTASPGSTPARPAPPSAAADGPLTQLKGLGPKVAAKLGEHGIATVGQLAALTDDEAEALDARLGPFTGRMGRDRWQEQARFLAAGDRAGFESVFGRL